MSTANKVGSQITGTNILLVEEQGQRIVARSDALRMADDLGLDLVQVGMRGDGMAVCKIQDHGKLLYEAQKAKKSSEKKNRANRIIVKEIQLRPNIGKNDLDRKIRDAKSFLEEGNRVRIAMRFNGREQVFKDSGRAMLQDIINDLDGYKAEAITDTGRNLSVLVY